MRREMHPFEPEELMAYLDGELSATRASEAALHLSQCRECQAEAADIQSISRSLLAWQVDEPGPGVECAANLVTHPEPAPPAWTPLKPWVTALAATLIAGFVLVRIAWPPAAGRAPFFRPAFDRRSMPLSQAPQAPVGRAAAPEPLIVRTAQVTLATNDFDNARASLEEILMRHGGHIGNLTLGSPNDSGRSLQASLRIPAPQLDGALSEVRRLGRIETEQQRGEEVTRQVVDLDARLANTRNTEQRLGDILRRDTGNMSDVLEVEKEISRVRGEIESMEAERKTLGDRIAFATLDVRLNEEYKAHLAVAAPSTFGRLRNSAVEGYRNVAGTVTGIAAFLLSYVPVLALWAALLFFPIRFVWRWLN